MGQATEQWITFEDIEPPFHPGFPGLRWLTVLDEGPVEGVGLGGQGPRQAQVYALLLLTTTTTTTTGNITTTFPAFT